MTAIEQRPNTLPWPPVIYLGALALGLIVHWLWPLPWLPSTLAEFMFAIGWLVVAGAVALEVAAMRAMSRARTTIMPNRRSDHLVTGGPFAITRNPIYLGNTMMMMGIGLITGIALMIPMALVAAFVTGRLAIAREERHLEARFGKAYRDYAKKVRRWI